MNEQDKIKEAVANLKKITNFDIYLNLEPTDTLPTTRQKNDFKVDGLLSFALPNQISFSRVFEFRNDVNGKMLNYTLYHLEKKGLKEAVLITDYVSQTTSEKLRESQINYIDRQGNAFIQDKDFYLLITGNRKKKNTQVIKLFSQASRIECLYYFLEKPMLLKKSYTEIQQQTGIHAKTISSILKELANMGFLLVRAKGDKLLINRKKLLERWIMAYRELLRPLQKPTLCQAIEPEKLINWKDLLINTTQTYWGSEPAADLLTNFLHPAFYTIYSRLPKQELMLKLRLVPHTNGNIELLNCFWEENFLDNEDATLTTSPLLVYADLISSGDSRNFEVAQRIYEKYLSDFFEAA